MSRTLEARQLTKHFAGTRAHFWSKSARIHAVDDVSFTLRPGRITALVGESGSGKSTVAQLLARLYDPTAGRIVFDGQDATGHASRAELLRYRSRVQMIFQDPFGSLNPVKTVEHHLRRPLLIHGLARREHVRAHIHELLATVGLVPPDEFAAKYPHQLSGGQRQRVAIARALAVEPSVLLADEPISMLDVSIRIGILNLMLKLKEELGIAFLYVTHDIASARYVADEVLVMYAGQIVEQGPTESVLQEPLHPYTRLLLSAVPEPGAVAKRIEPRPPRSDVDLLAGCRFVDRCPLAIDVCTHVPPKLVAARLHHSARCHVTAPAPDREDDRVEHLHELRS
jgi:peptide/nickel transport system ATP-binding protein